MTEMSEAEASGRVEIAAVAYADWPTVELWNEFGLLTDEAWEDRTSEEGPEPEAWAKREAIGLALIDRGATAAEVSGIGVTPERFRGDWRMRNGQERSPDRRFRKE